MPQHDEKHVILEGGIVIWDELTRPVVKEKAKSGFGWSLKVVFPPHCADLPIFDALANRCLMESPFRGVVPAGGHMPMKVLGPADYNGMFNGWVSINFKTTLKAPDVWNEQGVQLEPMQYGPMVFAGQVVNVLADCYDYNNVQKGIGAGLAAVRIIQSANAQRIEGMGTGGVDTRGAFGAPALPGPVPQYTQPAIAGPAGAPPAQPAYGQPAAQPAYGQPAAYAAPAAAPGQTFDQNGQPVYNAPAATTPEVNPAYGQPAAAPAAQPAYGAPQPGNAQAPAPIAGNPGAPASATTYPSSAPQQAAPHQYMPAQ
jgi:hypothetical protein